MAYSAKYEANRPRIRLVSAIVGDCDVLTVPFLMQSAGRPLTSELFDVHEEADDCIRVEIYNKKVEVLYWNTASRFGLLARIVN